MSPWSSLFLISNTNKDNRKIPFIVLPEVLPPMIFHQPELRLWDSLVLRFPSRLLHAGMDASSLTCAFLPSSLLIELIITELFPCAIHCAGCYLSTCYVPLLCWGLGRRCDSSQTWLLLLQCSQLRWDMATRKWLYEKTQYRCARINTGYAGDI